MYVCMYVCMYMNGLWCLEVCDEHAELRAPVAHVVEPEHVVSEELHHAAQRVADDRRPQVTLTGHLMGNIVQ